MKPTKRTIVGASTITAGALLCAGAAVAYGIQQNHTTEITDSKGTHAVFEDKNRVGSTDDGKDYAPRPATEFHQATCDLTATGQEKKPRADQVMLPALNATADLTTTAAMSQLPEAPRGARYTESAPIGSADDNTIIAGHVDYAPGAKTADGGELSELFGQLHTLHECDHLYAADESGQVHEYVLTDLYTHPQEDISSTGIYDAGSPAGIDLVTCSGPALEDVGGKNQFRYNDNLMAHFTPVEVGS